MFFLGLHSRNGLGTDVIRHHPESSAYSPEFPSVRVVRVLVGRLGAVCRFTVPALDIVVDADSQENAWRRFLDRISERQDAAWLAFDVGPIRQDEMDVALDAPDDEDWAEPVRDERGEIH